MMNVIMGPADYGYSLLCFQSAVLDNRLLLTICFPFLSFQNNIIVGVVWGGRSSLYRSLYDTFHIISVYTYSV